MNGLDEERSRGLLGHAEERRDTSRDYEFHDGPSP